HHRRRRPGVRAAAQAGRYRDHGELSGSKLAELDPHRLAEWPRLHADVPDVRADAAREREARARARASRRSPDIAERRHRGRRSHLYAPHASRSQMVGGPPFTIRDWIFTWRWIADPKNRAVGSLGWSMIASADAKDDSTAIVKLKQPYVPFV